MELIILPRAAGKTHALVMRQQAIKKADPKARPIIITFSKEEAERIRYHYDLDRYDVMSWHQYAKLYPGTAIRPAADRLLIDNAELILQMLARQPIEVITISSEIKKDHDHSK